ncbi:hypothetical protein FIBSPDRAFT_902751 [Athelia psychrophila]|uniref:Uncharacterized protein n=1 Tax=Athelia psychrophila TaxID=1759441 RepID=A0A167WV02_9AGAM|nr:hypothetical protein FIBSPDRAFT_902751 [Fibularhizoctonia sp. CBS 109695]
MHVPLCYLLQHPRSTTIPNPKWSDTAAKPPLQKNPTSKAKSASASAASASASASATLHPAPLVRTTRPRSKVEPQVVKPKWKHCNKEEMALAREANVLAKAAATVEKEAKLVECSEAQQSDTEAESEFQGEEVRSQWANHEHSEEVKSKAVPKVVEVDEQEDFELTPMVKKVKPKGMLFTREAINGQCLSKHSDSDYAVASLDQRNAKVTDPKKDVSTLVTIHIQSNLS